MNTAGPRLVVLRVGSRICVGLLVSSFVIGAMMAAAAFQGAPPSSLACPSPEATQSTADPAALTLERLDRLVVGSIASPNVQAPEVQAPASPVVVNADRYVIGGTAAKSALVRVWSDTDGNGRRDPGEPLAGAHQLSSDQETFSIKIQLVRDQPNRFIVTAAYRRLLVTLLESDATVVPTITQDSTPPSAPAGLSVSPTDGPALRLSWKPSPSGDVARQCVLRAPSAGGAAVVVASFADNTTAAYVDIDPVLAVGAMFSYRVVAVDRAGNLSAASNEVAGTVGVVVLAGRVVQVASRSPVQDVVVRVGAVETRTAADGTFTLRSIPNGQATVHISGASIAPTAYEVTIPATSVELGVDPVTTSREVGPSGDVLRGEGFEIVIPAGPFRRRRQSMSRRSPRTSCSMGTAPAPSTSSPTACNSRCPYRSSWPSLAS